MLESNVNKRLQDLDNDIGAFCQKWIYPYICFIFIGIVLISILLIYYSYRYNKKREKSIHLKNYKFYY